MDALTQRLLTKEAEAREALEKRVAKVEGISAQLSSGSLQEGDAKAKAVDQVVDLEKKIAGLEEVVEVANRRTMDDFTPIEKAEFVIAWGRGLAPEKKAKYAEAVGITMAATKEPNSKEPFTIKGKTDKPGYKYIESINTSVKQ